jgi:RNA polymerase sigma factor (TIGR02999 family)
MTQTPPDLSKGGNDITMHLERVSRGETEAVNGLLPTVYDELRAMAHAQLSHERAGHTLQATALVHEAYMKLVGQRDVRWQGRAHFFALASQAMRRILVDHARSAKAQKRGGTNAREARLDLAQIDRSAPASGVDLLALDEAMVRLSAQEPEAARVVEMKFFGGATEPEIAAVLGVSDRTVRRHWTYARAWLFRELRSGFGHIDGSSATELET